MADKLLQIKSSLPVVQDHSRRFGDFAFVYPVISRRSRGLSLCVNVNPDKACNFDCVYCEVDRRVPGQLSDLDLEAISDELCAMIHFAKDGGLAKEPKFNDIPWLTRSIKDIAFSGDGEPTLIENFDVCAERVAAVRLREGLDRAKIVLVTNGAGLDKPSVRAGLEILDRNNGQVWAKLDAGSNDYFRKINRTNLSFPGIVENILVTARERPIIIQSLFLRLRSQTISPPELKAYCQLLIRLVAEGAQIQEVHAYTTARPTIESEVGPLSEIELEQISEVIRSETGLGVATFP